MEWHTTLYVVLAFLTSAVMSLLAIYAWQHRQASGATAFSLLLVIIIEWSITAALEVLSPTEVSRAFWANLKYLGVATAPPTLLIFTLQYTKQQRWATRRTIIGLSIIPFLSQLAVWTNSNYHLWQLESGMMGPWFWVHTTYSFTLVFTGLTLMALSVIRASALKRWQMVLIILGITLPLIVNILLTFGFIPRHIDPTPIAFTATAIAFAWTLYRHKLFDLTPLARDTLIDGMQDSVIILDTQYQIVDHNPAAQMIFAYAGETLNGHALEHVFPQWRTLQADLETHQMLEAELMLSPDNVPHDYEVRITPLYDHRQILAGYLMRMHDITARKQSEIAIREYALELETRNAELDARNAELDAFAHTVAHDLKNPLSVLVGFSGLLESRLDRMPQEKVLENLHRITLTGQKMTNIVNELLLLSSVRKVDEITKTPLDTKAILVEVMARLEGLIAETRGEILMPNDWPVAIGHAPWIEQIWINYISNALKYGGRPEESIPPIVELGYDTSQITHDASQSMMHDNSYIRFWVRDNGHGLTEAQQAQLFTQFTRLHEVRAEGHGLGLSIVQRIVDKLNGEAGVESQIGHGSIFWFSLPVNRADQ